MASDSGIITSTLRQRWFRTEVAKSGTVCHSLATRVGQPRSGAQVLVLRTKTNLVGKADQVATLWALGVIISRNFSSMDFRRGDCKENQERTKYGKHLSRRYDNTMTVGHSLLQFSFAIERLCSKPSFPSTIICKKSLHRTRCSCGYHPI